MSELALYRKYRSGDFSEVIGQDHVVRTLTAALASGRLRHAYLFTGPRGVGKTSVARLLARALNCTGEPKPCNQCANCQTALNSSLDIIEMDAASNRSIDAVRDLREKVGLAPTAGRFKVYIIDEVHMLTTEAFNALLKTLEEPPAHAVFILATTEAHKLPETIISRTQAFNFKPITTADLIMQLERIAASENIHITPDALSIIAETARGGFRDAISLLDQLANASSSLVDADHVRELLGYTAEAEIAALAHAVAARDTPSALAVATRLGNSGAQASIIATQLANLWRQVLLASTDAVPSPSETISKLVAAVPTAVIANIINALLEVTRSSWPQLTLETTLVRLTATDPAPAQDLQTNVRPANKHTPTPKASAVEATSPSPNSADTKPQAPSTPSPSTSELWPKVLVGLKAQNNSLAALLQMYPVDFDADEITIKPRFNFHRDLFLKPANRLLIETAAAKVYGRPIKISARTDETARTKRARPDATAELVSSALEILGGEIVE